MNGFGKYLMVVTTVLSLLLAVELQAAYYARGAAEGDPDNYTTYGHSVGVDVSYTHVSNDSVQFSQNFEGISDTDFSDNVYAIKGSEVAAGDPGCWVENIGTGIGIGRYDSGNTAFYRTGKVVWHFQAPTGTTFAGGTASIYARAEGFFWEKSTEKYSLRLVDQRPTFSRSDYTVSDGAIDIITGFSEWKDNPSGNTGYYLETLSINIPTGVSEFWLIFENSWPELLDSGLGDYVSSTAQIKSIAVDAQIVPEPATMILLGLGSFVLIRKKK